jgi:hypothetical protein
MAWADVPKKLPTATAAANKHTLENEAISQLLLMNEEY